MTAKDLGKFDRTALKVMLKLNGEVVGKTLREAMATAGHSVGAPSFFFRMHKMREAGLVEMTQRNEMWEGFQVTGQYFKMTDAGLALAKSL